MRETAEKKTAERLAAYRIYAKMLHTAALRETESGGSCSGEQVMLRMRMREIERMLRDLPVGDARLLLEMHYLQGMSVERCAEELGVSRATAFRLKRRGLALIAARENRLAAHA